MPVFLFYFVSNLYVLLHFELDKFEKKICSSVMDWMNQIQSCMIELLKRSGSKESIFPHDLERNIKMQNNGAENIDV